MTITNLGMFEIEQFDAIINPPQGCILAVGAIVREPVVDGDAVVAGERMQLTLSFDHRLVDGALAARFLQRVKHLAEAGADFTALS
jgi:pyruvate dehydrogenase E2 component (dihydrolipoamide acetyltransferase)